ncbi:MAG TPA: hypothetical protein VMV69_02320 [Pirellulales bacterium]|nr:hypothetical protein [Pirellulales bacterium]
MNLADVPAYDVAERTTPTMVLLPSGELEAGEMKLAANVPGAGQVVAQQRPVEAGCQGAVGTPPLGQAGRADHGRRHTNPRRKQGSRRVTRTRGASKAVAGAERQRCPGSRDYPSRPDEIAH